MGKILIIKGADFSKVAVTKAVELTPIWSNAQGFFYAVNNKWYSHSCAAATGYNVTAGQVIKVSILNNTQHSPARSGGADDNKLIMYNHYAIATKNGTQKPKGNSDGVNVGFIKAYKTLDANTAPVQGSEMYTITEDGVLVVHHYDDQNIKVELMF